MRILVRLGLVAFLSGLVLALAGSAAETREPRKKVVLLISEPEYETASTLPKFAERELARDFRVTVVSGPHAGDDNAFDQLGEIATADVLVVSVRRRTPLPADLDLIRRHVAAGKPVVGIRTSSHAFAVSANQKLAAGKADWPEWDAEVIGGHYTGHHERGPITTVTAAGTPHALLQGVSLPFTSDSTLYKTSPLRPGAKPVLSGSIGGRPAEPVAWTFTRRDGGRTFYTSLGGVSDFANPSFVRLLRNGIHWAAASDSGRGNP